jgi:HK97 family phage prohead protease
METLRDLDLVRALPAQAHPTEVRAAKDDSGSLGRLVVRFSPFDTWYEINSVYEGRFLERTVPGAFTKTMQESRDSIRVQFDHGHDTAVGSRVLGKVADLREDEDGAVLEADLFDTSYNRDLLPGLQANAYGSSFRFRAIKDSWTDDPGRSEHNPDGIPERTLTEVRMFEAGPVVFGASPTASAGMRSMTDAFWERERSRAASPQVEELLARARELRAPKTVVHVPAPGFVGTPDQIAAALADVLDRNGRTSLAFEAATGTSEPVEAARTTDDEPATRHSSGYLPHQRRALIHPILSRKDTP